LAACPTHKKIFDTEAMAEEALIAAWITYQMSPGKGPVSIYRCGDCGGYHLTSKGEMNKKLKEHLESGKISKSKEAEAWLFKLKQKGKTS
jgi:hypothetical protein